MKQQEGFDLAKMPLPTTPYYGAPASAPPYHQPHPADTRLPHLGHPLQHSPADIGPQNTDYKQPPTVHFQNTFDSVDLDSVPNSPPVNRPMMLGSLPNSSQPRQVNGTDMEDGASVSSKKGRRYRRCVLYATIVVLLVVLTSVITGVLMMHFGPQRQPIPAEKLHTNCVSCAILEKVMADSAGRVPVNVAELDIKKSKEGKLLCCLEVSKKTDAFLEMLLEHARGYKNPDQSAQRGLAQNRTVSIPPSTTQDAAAQVPRRNPAAALVGLERNLPQVRDDAIYTLKEWGAQSSSVMYIRPRMRYSPVNGHFTVPFDGLYNINIHLSLANRDTKKEMKSFGQRLMRFNRHFPQAGNEMLAFDEENVPQHEQRTSSLALTVHLRKDDELFAQVSPASVVVESSSRSFFCIVFESA